MSIEAQENLAKKFNVGVKEALIEMQSYKCYLCEQKNAHTTHIEHFESKKKDHRPDLEFEWTNLFLSCDHCNSIKNLVSDIKTPPLSLLKPDDFSIIISDAIVIHCGPHPREKVGFSVNVGFEDYPKVLNTVHLLNSIFNYPSESLKFDAKNLTDMVIRELKELLDLLHDLDFKSDGADKKARIKEDIRGLLTIESPFTAFKIWYLRNNYSRDEIAEYLPVFESES